MKHSPLLLAGPLLLATAGLAQLVESIEVRVTNVDAVVTDRTGNRVTGLSRDDFEVLENGRRQVLTNFYEIRVAAPGEPDAAETEPVPAELQRRRMVIFIDNFSIDPFRRNAVFEALEGRLDSLLREGDEAMIVTWNRRRETVRPFTADSQAIRRFLRDAAESGAAGAFIGMERDQVIRHAQQLFSLAQTSPRAMPMARAYSESVNAAQTYAEALFNAERSLIDSVRQTITTLAGLDGKKVLLFVGGELQQKPGLDLMQSIDGIYGSTGVVTTPAVIRQQLSLRSELNALGKAAAGSGVTLYMVDVIDRGRRGDASQDRIDDAEAEFTRLSDSPMAMSLLASLTGGTALSGTRNFNLALDNIARDLQSYYSLGYRSDRGGEGSRNITVRVKGPGLRVRSRRSYAPKTADEELQDRLIANAFHPAVKSDLAVGVKTGKPVRDGSAFKVPLTVTFPSTITLLPRGDDLVGEFGVFVVVASAEGNLSPVVKDMRTIRIPAKDVAALGNRSLGYAMEVLVKPGQQSISVAVVDRVAARSGFARTTIIAQ